MFTGIIREIGIVERVARREGVARLSIRAPGIAGSLAPMESVAVNGVCLTLVRASGGVFDVEMVPETLRLTSLGGLRAGARLNLEPCLRLSDRLNGHFVLGHIDAAGTVKARRRQKGQLVLTIGFDRKLGRWIIPKGSIAVDGVSLTVGENVGDGKFSVYLIPETLRRTTLGDRRAGDRVNLEADYLAKVALSNSAE